MAIAVCPKRHSKASSRRVCGAVKSGPSALVTGHATAGSQSRPIRAFDEGRHDMSHYPPARLAAMLLRWAAQISSGETPELLFACKEPLRVAGYDMAALEVQARALANTALAVTEQHTERQAA